MCGLTGIFSSIISDEETKIFKELMILSSLRGIDSSGACVVSGEKTITAQIAKSTINPTQFLMEKHVKDMLEKNYKVGLMGHTRLATKGNINTKNAHPFRFHNIIGMHNGTCHGEFEGKTKDNTDSEAIFKNIEEKGTEEGLKYVTNKAWTFAYALIWYEQKTGIVNMIRNYERPLFYAVNKVLKTVFVSSEEHFLECVLKRNSTTYEKIEALPVNTLLSFDLRERDNILDTMTIKPNFVKPKIWPVAPISERNKHFNTNNKHKNKLLEDDWAAYFDEMENAEFSSIPFQLEDKRKNQNWKQTAVMYRYGYQNKQMLESDYAKLISKGCKWCQAVGNLSAAVRWINPTEYLCLSCASYSAILNEMNCL